MAGASPATRRAMERNREERKPQNEEVKLPEYRPTPSQPEEEPIRAATLPSRTAEKSMRTPIPAEQTFQVRDRQTYHQPIANEYAPQEARTVSSTVNVPRPNSTERYFSQADVTQSGTVVTEEQIYNAENRRLAQTAHTAADIERNRSAVDTAGAELAVTHMNSQRRTAPLLNGVNTAMQVVGAGAAIYNTIQSVTNSDYNYAHINNYQQPHWGVRSPNMGGLGNIVNIVTGGGSFGNNPYGHNPYGNNPYGNNPYGNYPGNHGGLPGGILGRLFR